MIQKTKKSHHTPSDVIAFSKNHKRHTLEVRTQGYGKSAVFSAKLNRNELIDICNYIESKFPIHKEDF